MHTGATFSLKVSRLSCGAMLAVMLIHSSDIVVGVDVVTWETVLLHFVGSSLTSWAVPYFFVVSGFFFWKSRDIWSNGLVAWKMTLRKKARTLLVPYLFWCIIGAVCVLPLIVWSNHVAGRGLFERTFIQSGTIWGSIVDCFGLDVTPRGNVPLWYVRALLSIFILSPLFVFVIRRMKWGGFCLACACAFVSPFLSIPFVTYQVRGLGYFYFGMMLSEYAWVKGHVPKKAVAVSGILVLLLFVDDLIWHKCTVFLPVALMSFIWGFYDFIPRFHKESTLPMWMRWTFWVYCLHILPTGYLLAIGRALFGKTNRIAVLLMFIIPLLVLSFSLVIGMCVNRFFPKVFGLLTGGRGCNSPERKVYKC